MLQERPSEEAVSRRRHAGRSLDRTRQRRPVEHERAIAIYDLVEDNHFARPDHAGRPYTLIIGVTITGCVRLREHKGAPLVTHLLR